MVGVGAGDVEVDITYITFMMTAQYTGFIGTVQNSHYDNKCSEYNWIYVHVIKSDRGY